MKDKVVLVWEKAFQPDRMASTKSYKCGVSLQGKMSSFRTAGMMGKETEEVRKGQSISYIIIRRIQFFSEEMETF